MAQRIPNPPPGFDDLSIEERLDYVQSLWDRIAAKPEEIQLPDWHRDILGERLVRYKTDPEEGRSWVEVREKFDPNPHKRVAPVSSAGLADSPRIKLPRSDRDEWRTTPAPADCRPRSCRRCGSDGA